MLFSAKVFVVKVTEKIQVTVRMSYTTVKLCDSQCVSPELASRQAVGCGDNVTLRNEGSTA